MAIKSSTTQPSEPIALTPGGKLRFGGTIAAYAQRLFALGAQKSWGLTRDNLYWHKLGAKCVHALCQLAQNNATVAEIASIPFPGEPEDWIEGAPPMRGWEYLNEENLRRIWATLLHWCETQAQAKGGLAAFLNAYAPGWSNAGRLYFHLGENKLNEERPFAFLATVAMGAGDKGRQRHMPLAAAIRQQAEDRAAQIHLIERLGEAAEAAPFLGNMLASGAIYQSVTMTPNEAHEFLLAAPALEDLGIGVRLPDWWKKKPRLRVEAEVSARDPARMGANALLDFDLRVAVGDANLSEAELHEILNSPADSLVLVKNNWVEVDRDKLCEALAHWQKVKEAADAGELTFSQGMRMLSGLDLLGDDINDEEAENIRQWSHLSAGAGFREILRGARESADCDIIDGLEGELRPYQRQGVQWLRFLSRIGLGACLADDMGLGKTIQILALLLLQRREGAMPALLLVPASLLASWQNEIKRFAPSLRATILHGSALTAAQIKAYNDPEKLRQCDLVITSYAMNTRLPWLADMDWSLVIADEAQNIKNARTRQSIAARKLKAPARIALTGTPIENSLNDLWTLFDFLNPGLLGGAREFDIIRRRLENSPEGLAPLRRLTAPYILRRMKTDKNIISTLPDKTEMPLYCGLTKEQASLYQKVVEKMRSGLADLSGAAEDRGRRNVLILQSMMALKQICNHPAQAGAGGSWEAARSGKFQRVGELCAEIAEREERVLLFTQFREIIPALSAHLEKIFGAPGLVLHGGIAVKKRGELVAEFQKEDGPPFFILSLKAGGTGLTLTEASHVIHFDRWWNPAVEDQATDRAYRIGQEKNVLVHKCLATGTLEEKIADLIESKRDLAAQMLDGLDTNMTNLSDAEIMDLVRLDARRALE